MRVFLEEADKDGEWAEKNPKQVAKIFAPVLKLDEALLEAVSHRRTYRLRKLTSNIVTE